jgi:ribosomal-protein-alanine N-acetyltransferase
MTTTRFHNNKHAKVMAKASNVKKDFLRDPDPFRLHQGRISLYPFGRGELYSDAYLKWMNDPEITKTIGRYDYLMPVSRKKLVDYYRSLDQENTIFLAIYLESTSSKAGKKNRAFVGTLKIYDIDKLARRASIGIVIGERDQWGRGHAATAINIAVEYVFHVLGLRKVTAGYLANNIGMARVFQKAGFEQEARFKEHVFFRGDLVDHIFVCKFRG